MTRTTHRHIALLLLATTMVALSACGPERVRAQSLYLRVQHAVLFSESGRGSYVIELQSIRNLPELSIIEVELERPGGRPWRQEITVEAGQRRFQINSPAFNGFEPDQFYWIRVRLIGLDRFTVLDHLRQRVQPTLSAVRGEE